MSSLTKSGDDRLAEAFCRAHPAYAARSIERLEVPDAVTFCRAVDPAAIAPVLARMHRQHAATVLASLEVERGAKIIEHLDAPTGSLLLRGLPPERRHEFLEHLPRREAVRLRDVLRYPADTAGALCDPSALTVPDDWTVAEAVDAVRGAKGAYYYVFAVDRDQHLEGVVNLRDLLMTDGTVPLGNLLRREFVCLQASASAEAILAHPSWQSLPALPVVDETGRFLGLLRHETMKQLEADTGGTSLTEATTHVVLELGELVWSAGGPILGELADAIASPTRLAPGDPA